MTSLNSRGLDLAGASIAVTGATGCIGRHIVRSLQARGAHVVGVVRTPDKVPSMVAAGVEMRRADLADPLALQEAFRGVDALISNAGLVSVGGASRELLVQTNVEGTRNTLAAAAKAGVSRVVMTSSASVYRPRPDNHYLEHHALRQEHDRVLRPYWYAVSKAVAEQEAWRLSGELGLNLTTVRPHAVHAAHDLRGITAWLKWLMRPPVTFWVTHTRLPSVYAGDIGEAMCLMLERSVSEGKAYNIAGEPGKHTLWEMLEAWRAAGGRVPPVVIPIPMPIQQSLDITAATHDLGWRNRPLGEGFAELVELERAGIS